MLNGKVEMGYKLFIRDGIFNNIDCQLNFNNFDNIMDYCCNIKCLCYIIGIVFCCVDVYGDIVDFIIRNVNFQFFFNQCFGL